MPLFEENKLNKLIVSDAVGQFGQCGLPGPGIQNLILRRPFMPGTALMQIFERHKQSIVFQPILLGSAEVVESFMQGFVLRCSKMCTGFAEQSSLISDHIAVFNRIIVEIRYIGQVILLKKTVLQQQIRADEQRLTGKS